MNLAAGVTDSGSGDPLLLLHGWGASRKLFEQLVAHAGNGHRVIAPDLPGFGDTPPPERPFCVDDYVDWVVSLMDSRSVAACDIVAHSFGGRVAIKLAAQYPERVRRLLLTDAAGVRPSRSLRYHARVAGFRTARWLAQAGVLPAALARRMQQVTASAGSPDYQRATGVMRDTFVRVVNEDLRTFLPGISHPVLLVWGEVDTETPLGDGKLMERLLPNGVLVVLEGCGHFAYLEEPARFARIMDAFLKE